MDATIVIPTKNAGTLLEKVLEAVFCQKTAYQYEVVCVDSGSKDETLAIIRKFPCRLYEIPPEEFGHGKTRNYGAGQGSGEFIVFLTQDAMPASDTWLQSLLDAMKADEAVAGGFGIHYPYPDCNLPDKIMLRRHFLNFGTDNTVTYVEDMDRFKNDEGYRAHLSFFSDNNSCLRRSIWEQYPYDDVNFAEDQVWMAKMMEKGYKRVYCPFAPVYHSHNYDIKTYKGRHFDEYYALYKLYGKQSAPGKIGAVKGTLLGTGYDVKNIWKEKISIWEKIKWSIYALRRNAARYTGAYYAGKFDTYSKEKQEKLTAGMSQQYKQRKA